MPRRTPPQNHRLKRLARKICAVQYARESLAQTIVRTNRKGPGNMMLIPVPLLAFFIALMVIPANVHQFSIELRGRTTQYTKSSSSVWHAVVLPEKHSADYSVSNTVVTVRAGGDESKMDVSQFIKVGKESAPGKIQQIELASGFKGTPVLIQKTNETIILSQEKGSLFEKPVVISWKPKGK
jgi:hypothetical protein